MKKIFLTLAVTIVSLFSFGQNEIDALRFSQTNWEGTARFMSAGGAFGAVGGDFSALSTNPASIAVFKKSTIVLTPLVLSFNKVSAIYNDNLSVNLTAKYTFNNFGGVFVFNEVKNTKWKCLQLGIGYNRILDFNRTKFIAQGGSMGSSIAVPLASSASGYDPDDMMFEEVAAWDSYLFDQVPGSENDYYYPHTNANLKQTTQVYCNGGIDEMTISGGGNWDNKLFIGATLGIDFLSYNEKRYYNEYDKDNVIENFIQYSLNDDLDEDGTGINLKLGLLYQPVDFFRFGVAFHTPTYYGKIKYNLDREISSYWTRLNDLGGLDSYSSNNSFTNLNYYKLITPLRAMVNTAFLIQKRAFISLEYEFSDYSTASMASRITYNDSNYDLYLYEDENKSIANSYGISHNVRVGAEVNLSQYFQIRAGYSFKSSPYQTHVDNDASLHTGSVGIGFRGKSFFMDFAYLFSISNENYWFYDDIALNPVMQKYTSHRAVMTMGWKF